MSFAVRTLPRHLLRTRILPTTSSPRPAGHARIRFYQPSSLHLRQNHNRSLTPPTTETGIYRSAIDLRTLLVAAVLSLGIAFYGASYKSSDNNQSEPEAGEQKVQVVQSEWENRYLIIDVMGPQPLPGRPGNLTAEQEAKLKDMWAQTFEVWGWPQEEIHKAQANGTSKASSVSETPKKKRGIMGRFSRKSKDEDSEDTGSAVDNDKHGQIKEFEQALASMKPEEIREAFWNMSKHDHPDAILLRFLRARKWDIHAAQVMALSTLHWRLQDVHVDDDIMLRGEEYALKQSKLPDAKDKKESEDFLQQYRLGKSMLHGIDKDGRPCCYVRVRLHRAGEQCTESLERFTIHTIETARMLLRPPVDTATIVFDMTEFGIANMDYTPVKFMIKVFEANYPESLGSVIVYKSPWVFQQFWRIIRGWLDPVVASKVHFSSNVRELEEHIPKSNIIKELGGDMDWSYQYVEPKEGENKIMEDTASKEKLLEERRQLTKDYELETIAWINGEDRTAKRDEIAQKLSENYWKLDPYLRARSLYDRIGVIGPMGRLEFYPEKKAPDTTTSQDDVD